MRRRVWVRGARVEVPVCEGGKGAEGMALNRPVHRDGTCGAWVCMPSLGVHACARPLLLLLLLLLPALRCRAKAVDGAGARQ